MRAAVRLTVQVLVVFVLSFLVAPSVHAYRTFADEEHDVLFDSPPGWVESPVFLLEVRDPRTGPSAAIERAVLRGFSVWAHEECALPAPSFVGYIGSNATSDGQITWVSHYETGLPRDVIATTDIIVEHGVDAWAIVSASIVLNDVAFDLSDGFGFSDATSREIRLEHVIAHELGHVVGLAHPCWIEEGELGAAPRCGEEHSRSIMNPLYFESDQVELSQDDRDGICAIYGTSTQSASDEPCEGCLDADLGYGLACERPEDCVSGVCIVDGDGLGFCSLECGREADCHAGFACEYFGDVGSFCVPPNAGGCSVGDSAGGDAWVMILIVVLLPSIARKARESNR